MASILNLPNEVIQNCIFKHLNFNHILALRRTCKHVKLTVDDYFSQNQHALVSTILINNGEKSFERFMTLGYIVSSVRIESDSQEEYLTILGSSDAFLDKNGKYVTSLSLDNFCCCKTSSEMKFFEGFSSLKELHIKSMSLSDAGLGADSQYPVTFKNLSKITISKVVIPISDQDTSANCLLYISKFLNFCEKITHINMPAFQFKIGPEEYVVATQQIHFFLDTVRQLIISRAEKPDAHNLVEVDLTGYEIGRSRQDHLSFYELIRTAFRNDVQFTNLNFTGNEFVYYIGLIRMQNFGI